jgi:hypothetical protein
MMVGINKAGADEGQSLPPSPTGTIALLVATKYKGHTVGAMHHSLILFKPTFYFATLS